MGFCADPDSLFGYTTGKKVIIRDRVLGLAYYFCASCVLAYVIGGALLGDHGYLTFDDVAGTTSVLLVNPTAGFNHLASRPYCTKETPCQLWDEHDVRRVLRTLASAPLPACGAPCSAARPGTRTRIRTRLF